MPPKNKSGSDQRAAPQSKAAKASDNAATTGDNAVKRGKSGGRPPKASKAAAKENQAVSTDEPSEASQHAPGAPPQPLAEVQANRELVEELARVKGE
jgi:hypothetical protein